MSINDRDRLELVTRCRRCGVEWIPVRSDYLRGSWHTCPRCRTEAEPEPLDAQRPDDGEEGQEAA